MKKYILFLLLFSFSAFAYLSPPAFVSSGGTVTSVNSDPGPAVNLDTDEIPEGTKKYFSSALAKAATVADVITDGVLDVAPSQNSVFDALATKLSSAQLSTRRIYVDPVNGSDGVIAFGRGSVNYPYATIQAAFDGVALASSLNQWANERLMFHLLGAEYAEAAPVVWFKRRSVNFIGDGAKIVNNFTLNYDPTNQYNTFTYTQAGLPAPWTSGFASPTLGLGCAHNINGMESGFTTGCMLFLGRVIFTTPNYTTQTTPNYGPSYIVMNGVEARSGFQVNDSGSSSNSSVVLETMNTVISGTTGTHNIGATRAGGVSTTLTIKAADSRLTADIGPLAIIQKLDACRIGKIDRNFGGTTLGAIQFTNTTSTTGITNCSFTSATNNIGNETGTTNSVVKIDKASWYQLRATSTTLTTGGGITYNIMDQDKYVRVVAVNAGSTAMTVATDHLLLDPASTIASYTVTMKAAPVDGDEVIISAGSFGVTALTLTPSGSQTFMTSAAAVTLPANSFVRYKWIGGTVLKWANIGSGISSFTGDVSGSGVMGAVNLLLNNSVVTNAKVASGIDAVKLADGSVDNTEFQFINSLTSNAQTQLNAKQASLGFTSVSTSAAIDFANTLAASFSDQTITLTGANVGDIVMLGLPSDQENTLNVFGIVSAANTVLLRAQNVGTIAVDQASKNYRITVLKY